ncbi:hypothetical protein ACQKQC_06200 [Vibrio fortis]|uniref:hypothetical protein n=1 Tax=Vibrio fortis TaxID=212667 RepID=UPI0040698231
MTQYQKLPERLLTEIPQTITDKIHSGLDLDPTDKKTAKSYLEKKLIHPQNICDSKAEVSMLLRLYMVVGARIAKETVEYVSCHINDEGLVDMLSEYDNVIEYPIVELNSNVLSQHSFSSFWHINADRGPKRWNLYAENFCKLVVSIKRWVSEEAPHLKNNCKYAVKLDSKLIGYIEPNKIFRPLVANELEEFIYKYFGSPINLTLDCSLKCKGGTGVARNSVKGLVELSVYMGLEKQNELSFILPSSNTLKLEMVKEKIVECCKEIVDSRRYRESITSDIQGFINLNGVQVGVLPIESNKIVFGDDFARTVECALGYELKDVVSCTNGDSDFQRRGFLKRVLSWLSK